MGTAVCGEYKPLFHRGAGPGQPGVGRGLLGQPAHQEIQLDVGRLLTPQRAVVVEDQRDLRDVQGTPLRRARENDILRARAAQVADVLLAEHPAHGIRDIALAAAVRADNRRDAVVEFNGNLVGKGLESICLKAF